MAPGTILLIKADSKILTISVESKDFTTLCDTDILLWTNSLNEVRIYGLESIFNNYDNYRHVVANIDLCDLQNNNEIIFNFIDG